MLAEFKKLNMLSVTVYTNLNTLIIFHDATRLIIKLTLVD